MIHIEKVMIILKHNDWYFVNLEFEEGNVIKIEMF